jgi:hypothetical protein
MSTIKGKVREQTEDFGKKIGMVEVSVIAINPTIEQYADVLGIELKEDSKAANYLGESNDGNNYVRVDFWLQTVKDGQKFKTSFFLEDKNRMNKDETKQQYINNIGVCSWAADEDTLPSWFAKRDYRNAYSGEEDFYAFLRNWLGGLDYRDEDTELQLSWKDLMKGKLKDIQELIEGDYATSFVAMATVIIKGEGEDTKEYQGIYNKGFLPAYTMRHFTVVDYSNPEILARVQAKVGKDLKPHERFMKNASGEYGCKDIYSFKPMAEYIAEEHFQASDEAAGGDGVTEAGSDY